uniref:Uncharacterized protein n=1 Tax=Timema bartmani TaxID=61472 RepID=A0A7R9I0G6_9NEOP|nr:unnamed protein product [Timema bartmani]
MRYDLTLVIDLPGHMKMVVRMGLLTFVFACLLVVVVVVLCSSGVELSSCRRQGLGGGRVRGDVRELSHLPLPPHPCRPSLASHCLPLGSSARAKSPGSEDREFVRRLILKAETVSNLAMPTHHHDGEMSEDELEKKRMLLLQELQKQD